MKGGGAVSADRPSGGGKLQRPLVILLGVAGVSLSAVFTRWSTAPALVLALYRMALSAALMAVPALTRRRDLASVTRRDAALCLLSGCFLGLHFTAYFAALERTSIAAAVVLVDTEVLFVALVVDIAFLKCPKCGKRLPLFRYEKDCPECGESLRNFY